MSPRTRNRKTAAATKNVTPPADTTPDDGLDELSDEELAAKVAEKFPDYDPALIPIAIAEKRDQVIADLRNDQPVADVDANEAGDDDVEPERAAIAEAPTADLDAEFPTEWHRTAYIEGLEREVEGAKLRVEELTAFGVTDDVLADAKTLVKNAQAELKRVTTSKDA